MVAVATRIAYPDSARTMAEYVPFPQLASAG